MAHHPVTTSDIIEEWPDATVDDILNLADSYRVLSDELSELAQGMGEEAV
jgi:hypothetical protein